MYHNVQLGLTCKFLNKLLADLLAGSYLPRCVVVCSLNSTLVELDIVSGELFDALQPQAYCHLLISAALSRLPPSTNSCCSLVDVFCSEASLVLPAAQAVC